jgi:hypothetical protein
MTSLASSSATVSWRLLPHCEAVLARNRAPDL